MDRESSCRYMLIAQKKDLFRREDKGRRCLLGDKIDSIPRLASYFALGRIEGQADLHIEKWKNSEQISLFFNSSLCKIDSAARIVHRRRMYTKGKTKVVAAVWVTILLQFPANQPIHQLVLVHGIKEILSPKQQRRPLTSLLYM